MENPELEEEEENDPTADGDLNDGEYGSLFHGLREEVNAVLRREPFRDAADFQQVVLYVGYNSNARKLSTNSAT